MKTRTEVAPQNGTVSLRRRLVLDLVPESSRLGLLGLDVPRRVIAVGTHITVRPPHKTERAQFGHSASTSGD